MRSQPSGVIVAALAVGIAVVALHDVRPAHPSLADFAFRHVAPIRIDEADLDAGERRTDRVVVARVVDAGLGDRRRRLGEAVAVVERAPEARLDAPLPVEIERRAAGRHVAQARRDERFAAVVEVLEKARVHRRDALEHGDAAAQGLGEVRRIEAVDEPQSPAGVDRAEAGRGEPEDVAQRQHGVDEVVCAKRPRGAGDDRDEEHVAMRQHHAFRVAGRARGVDHRRDLSGVRFVHGLGCRGQMAGDREGADAIIVDRRRAHVRGMPRRLP